MWVKRDQTRAWSNGRADRDRYDPELLSVGRGGHFIRYHATKQYVHD